jgi:hypothetical protein
MNVLSAFARSFTQGFGAELDVRDAGGELVVSHGPPVGPVLLFEEVVEIYAEAGQPGALAVNVKADGLANLIDAACRRHSVASYFCFDQSTPDLISYIVGEVPTFTRQSDIEAQPLFYEHVSGVWLDSFHDDLWLDEIILHGHLEARKKVCMVSPELHDRQPHAAWARWRRWNSSAMEPVFVCTDRPDELVRFMS